MSDLNPPKLMIYVQHLLGIGHQMRAAALTRACLDQGFDVYYISGGFPERLPNLGSAKFRQLPPVKTLDGDFNQLIDEIGAPISEEWWESRTEKLLSFFEKIKPDILLLEGFPFARRKFKKELIPLLEKVKEARVLCATSLRDILVDPAKEKKREFAFDISEKYLNTIYVHGEENFCPLERSFTGALRVKEKIVYTGYVDSAVSKDSLPNTTEAVEVVISAGGGAASEVIFLNAAKAKSFCPSSTGIWLFLYGPNTPEATLKKLTKLAKNDATIRLEPARKDFRNLLHICKLSISQAGYNTVMDILASGVKTIVVPFAQGGETEQSLRAELLKEKGRMAVIDEGTITPEGLALEIENQLNISAEQSSLPFPLNGAENTALHLMQSYRNSQK